MRKFNQAPLPFQGQKRKFLKLFREAIGYAPEGVTFVDLFGGSGLLSHAVKAERPSARVVFNDYDGYLTRLEAIPKTNVLLADLRVILKDHPREKRIVDACREALLDRIEAETGFVDFITLSSSLLFSMNYVMSFDELRKQTFYNNVRMSDYDAGGYLKGVEVVRMDYKELFARFAGEKAVVFLIDPPYLSTDCSSYSSDGYWKLADYLDVLDTLKTGNYFYFTSNKSSVVELCEWVSNKTGGRNPFEGARTQKVRTSVNYSSSYSDIMLYKFVGDE